MTNENNETDAVKCELIGAAECELSLCFGIGNDNFSESLQRTAADSRFFNLIRDTEKLRRRAPLTSQPK